MNHLVTLTTLPSILSYLVISIPIFSGFYDNRDGELTSLVVETVGGEREVAGNHEPKSYRNLIESPPSVEPPLQLSHLSGDERGKNWSVVFHYE